MDRFKSIADRTGQANGRRMTSDQMQSEIVELSSRFEELDDPRACYALLKERINSYRARGRLVPEAMQQMERILLQQCLEESQGR
jgi:hypothetical protein